MDDLGFTSFLDVQMTLCMRACVDVRVKVFRIFHIAHNQTGFENKGLRKSAINIFLDLAKIHRIKLVQSIKLPNSKYKSDCHCLWSCTISNTTKNCVIIIILLAYTDVSERDDNAMYIVHAKGIHTEKETKLLRAACIHTQSIPC